jgi:hypothetical protein
MRMRPISRRALLVSGAAIVGGMVVGGSLWEGLDVADMDALDRAVASLGGRCETLGPKATYAEGRALFNLLDDVRPFPARAVGRLSLTMARAALWSNQDAHGWVRMAFDAAKESGDDALLARCWEARATALGKDAVTRGVSAGPMVRGLLDAAAGKSGADPEVRSLAQYRLAYEHAAVGRRADARAALTRGEAAAALAGWSDERRGAFAGYALWALDELSEAEWALSEGTGAVGSQRLYSFANLARVHRDSGAPDVALEDLLQAAHEARLVDRLDITPHLRLTASTLPLPLRTIALQHLDT